MDWAICCILTNLTRYSSAGYCLAASRALQHASRWEVFIRTSVLLLVVKTLFSNEKDTFGQPSLFLPLAKK
jgi:hypothetical protein